MIIKPCSISCDGCGLTIWNFELNRSASKLRVSQEYKNKGFKLMVGDMYKYGDYCEECRKLNKHRKTLQNLKTNE